MPKAILVIDMPSCCVECPCYDFDLGLCSPKDEITDVDGRHDERAEWCPLKPLPKPMPYEQTDTQTVKAVKVDNSFRLGWNACLEEITK